MNENAFIYEPAADHPGWFTWDLADTSRFNGQTMGRMLTRVEDRADGTRTARLQMFRSCAQSAPANMVSVNGRDGLTGSTIGA